MVIVVSGPEISSRGIVPYLVRIIEGLASGIGCSLVAISRYEIVLSDDRECLGIDCGTDGGEAFEHQDSMVVFFGDEHVIVCDIHGNVLRSRHLSGSGCIGGGSEIRLANHSSSLCKILKRSCVIESEQTIIVISCDV